MDQAASFEVLAATWPPATYHREGPWLFRQSPGGGKRVMAASGEGPVTRENIEQAEQRMRDMGQPVLFQLGPSDPLDPILAEMGYLRVDETMLYVCPIGVLAQHPVPPVTAFPIWPPLQLARDIWDQGGIGEDRVAVMERAQCPRTAILGRVNDRAGGVCYAAIHKGCAMLHALEVLPEQRRSGLGRSLVVASAHWAASQNASHFALLVTRQNKPARALYEALGMQPMDGYHYRVKPD